MMRAPRRCASDCSARSSSWRAGSSSMRVHEGAVDLDELRRELHHRLEARVARAGVVERDLEAELAVGVAHLAEDLEVVDRLLLGDLEHHVGRAQPALRRACARARRRGTAGRGWWSAARSGRAWLHRAGRARRPARAAGTGSRAGTPGRVACALSKSTARRVQLAALGTARERLVAEDGARAHLDDRLVHGGRRGPRPGAAPARGAGGAPRRLARMRVSSRASSKASRTCASSRSVGLRSAMPVPTWSAGMRRV